MGHETRMGGHRGMSAPSALRTPNAGRVHLRIPDDEDPIVRECGPRRPLVQLRAENMPKGVRSGGGLTTAMPHFGSCSRARLGCLLHED